MTHDLAAELESLRRQGVPEHSIHQQAERNLAQIKMDEWIQPLNQDANNGPVIRLDATPRAIKHIQNGRPVCKWCVAPQQ